MNITKDIKNILLHRNEVEAMLVSTQNPGMEHTKKKLAEHFKVDENVVVVKKLDSRFGRDQFLVDAFIYKDVASKNMIEQKAKVKKAGAN